MRAEVGNHGAQRGAQGPHIGGDGATTGCGRLAGGLIGKTLAGHADQTLLGGEFFLVLNHVFDDFLLGVEGLQFVQSHGFDSHAYDLLFADTE